MQLEVVTIGGEILAGLTREGNFAVIAEELAQAGLLVARQTVVPDDRAALVDELRRACGRSEVVITTGGLGGTPDDLTRSAVAAVLDRKLVFQESLRSAIQERTRVLGIAAGPAGEAMALLPTGARPLTNPAGLAPGFEVRTARGHLYALPGVPEEMRAMLVAEVLPLLAKAGHGRQVHRERLRTVGVPESQLASTLAPLVERGVRIAYLPAAGRVDLLLSAPGDAAGEAALGVSLRRLQRRLGPALYATGNVGLAEAVLALLRQQGATLAVAESLTGGQVGAALTRVPGSSASFLGDVVAYSDRAKETLLGVPAAILGAHGAVSAAAAAAMAAGARTALGATIAVATTGIAGPGGGAERKPVGLVYCGVAREGEVRSFRYRMSGNRAMIQARTTTVALNLLRLALLERLSVAARHEVAPEGSG